MASSTGGAPDWVALTLRTAHESFLRMSQLGWPLPPSDRGAGGTAQFDVYLQDLGRRGLYGYCAPEQVVPGERNVASSYCVLDNDFAEFPLPPTPSMRVTVAHELFHAVQFGLDAREDGWLLEATATWMEEQVTDDVNDNRQYLVHGQLGEPRTPLDTFDSGLGSYGNWIFFQRPHPALRQSTRSGRSGPAPTAMSGDATTSRSRRSSSTSSRAGSRGRASTPASSPPTAPRARRTPRGRPTAPRRRRAGPASVANAPAGHRR